jgi:hypothetical protein
VADRDEFERVVAEHDDRLLHAAYGLCGEHRDPLALRYQP